MGRWAEISKRIPGSTGNAIKNHRNATRRRKNAKRKNRHGSESKYRKIPHSSKLEDYIRSNKINQKAKSITISDKSNGCGSGSTSLVDDPESNCESSHSLIMHPNDEELFFMQKLFGHNPGSHHQIEGENLPRDRLADNRDAWSKPKLMHLITGNHLSSDIYLSYLLNEAEVGCSAYHYECGYPNNLKGSTVMTDQAGASFVAREMNLMEMVSSSVEPTHTPSGSFEHLQSV